MKFNYNFFNVIRSQPFQYNSINKLFQWNSKKIFFEWNFWIKYLNDVLNYIFNSTPLYKAIEIENIEIIKILLSKEKIDVNRISI